MAALARSSIELYWPLIAGMADFDDASREPTFLNLETSQYHMANFVDLAIGQAEFDGIRIERSRVISQVLDNLNKAALQGFTIDEAYNRLELTVPAGEQRIARLNALNAARRISHQFRQLCLQESLIDFSLQTVLFTDQLLKNEWSRIHLFRSYRHIVFDNSEEDTVMAHRLVRAWASHLDSLLIVNDSDAGYRLFLGADPLGATSLVEACDETIKLAESHIMSPAVKALSGRVREVITGRRTVDAESEGHDAPDQERDTTAEPAEAFPLEETFIIPTTAFRFYPQMIEWIVSEVRRLIHDEGTPAEEIVLLAPFVSDALRFSVQTGLSKHNIDLATHRPSRALQNEPAARTLITLSKLAHPDWGIRPALSDVTLSLTVAIHQMDPVRANLLGQIVFPTRDRTFQLGRFGDLVPAMQQRISFVIGERFDLLRDWIMNYRASADVLPLDQFFARLFGEVLSQEGFGFHNDHDAARIANQLVDSARNFRWSLESHDAQSPYFRMGQEYIQLLESGALGALFAPGWRPAEEAVFLAPAYTFIMRNRPADVQFWLDIGSGAWWDRLYQPLTQPHVLSHHWPADQIWTDFDEEKTKQEMLSRLLTGLLRRTRRRVYLGLSDYSEQGFEQRGPLLGLINRLLAQSA